MALFSTPLYKPGNWKCPKCGAPVKRNSMGYLWSTRYCTQCGTALRRDVARSLAGLALITPLLAVWVWSIWDTGVLPHWVHEVAFFGYLTTLVLSTWWFPSIKLREEAPSKPVDAYAGRPQ